LRRSEFLFSGVPLSNFGAGGAKQLVSLLQNFGLSFGATSYLYDRYQQYPLTAKLLATYFVGLVLDTLPFGPLREPSNAVVFKFVRRHKIVLGKKTHDD